MPLWGTRDFVSGNNKPKYANTSNVVGINTAEAQAKARGATQGWVEVTRGRGFIQSITIVDGGQNYNSAGFLTITGGSPQTSANISFGVNSVSKQVNAVSIVNPGAGFLTMPTFGANATNSQTATFLVTMGGRFNRNTYETLVIVKNVTSNDTTWPV